MIFKSIRLKNFRQYKEEIDFNFSMPSNNKNNISLLIAANGVGKTTLLQAFRYCFYGKSSNYLNLPKGDELVNNTLIEDLKDLEEEIMFVEVSFQHENMDYVARRETNFMKSKGLLKETNEERFSLSKLIDKEGYKSFKESEANDKIRSILPEGLSQVFMFDGERMERNISDKAFGNELKESILGILDIKKYDKLIDILGNPGKISSVSGMLENRKRTNNELERKNKSDYDRLLVEKDDISKKIHEIESKIDEINNKIQLNKEQQKELDDNKERSKERDEIEKEINREEDELNDLASQYIKESKHALLYKLLILNKNKYDDFINLGRKHDIFYSYLHINTIEDIQEKGICVCGAPISEHSKEYDRLQDLKKTALPIESAQHLNLIDQKFKQCADYNDIMKRLEDVRSKMRQKRKSISDKQDRVHKISQEISKVEKQLGLSNQSEIDNLIDSKNNFFNDKGRFEEKLKIREDLIRKLQKKIDIIDKNSQYNQKINSVMEVVRNIKARLEDIKNEKDAHARKILSQKFNESLTKTIQGNYNVDIDQKYQVKITDKGNNKDVTNALSTGQNVVVSLTFIDALIGTAKELSKQINKDEKYGVIMDAALSNLDEVHIDRLCKNTINNMDQLIFLSVKRQLRNEMYQSIKDNIGKAYVIEKQDKGHVKVQPVEMSILEEYIHTVEE